MARRKKTRRRLKVKRRVSARRPLKRRKRSKIRRHPAHAKRRQVISWVKRRMRELRAEGNKRGLQEARAYLSFIKRNV